MGKTVKKKKKSWIKRSLSSLPSILNKLANEYRRETCRLTTCAPGPVSLAEAGTSGGEPRAHAAEVPQLDRTQMAGRVLRQQCQAQGKSGCTIWETPERCLKFESFYNKKGSVVFCFFVLSLHVGCVLYSNDCIDMTYGTCEGVACHLRFSSSDQSRGTRDFTFSRLKLFSSFIAISSTYHIV